MKGTCHPRARRGRVSRLPGQGEFAAKWFHAARAVALTASAETGQSLPWVRLGHAETQNQVLTVSAQERETRRATAAGRPYMSPSNKDVGREGLTAAPRGAERAHLPGRLLRACPGPSSETPDGSFHGGHSEMPGNEKPPSGTARAPAGWRLCRLSPGPGSRSHLVTASPRRDSHAVRGSG